MRCGTNYDSQRGKSTRQIRRVRRKDQIDGELTRSVFDKASRSTSRFSALNILVKMSVGYGWGIKSEGRKRWKQLSHACVSNSCSQITEWSPIVILIVKDIKFAPRFSRCRTDRWWCGVPELTKLQEYFSEYHIVVYSGVRCENIMFDGHVKSTARMNLICDDITWYYRVIYTI